MKRLGCSASSSSPSISARQSQDELTLRASQVWDMVPGEIVTVRARKQWRYAGYPYLSGDVDSHRLDVGVLGLKPLPLCDEWQWDPADEYWGGNTKGQYRKHQGTVPTNVNTKGQYLGEEQLRQSMNRGIGFSD